jgi:3-hydroxyisobutyrate dehydrogenase-like beta-hydroxyacid dehydrogenase
MGRRNEMGVEEKIGWIGLGKMGNPMCKNLIKAGFALTVFDILPSAVDQLTAEGAKGEGSPKSVASNVTIAITTIPDDQALEDVSLGHNGVFAGAKAGMIFIDMSTVSPRLSDRVAKEAEKKGIIYLRAPVSGSTQAAVDGTLTIMVSGPKDAYESCKNIFDVLGQKCFHVGRGEEARYLKLLVNMMVGITATMTAEALTFGHKGGLDWEQMIDIVNNSVVSSPLIGFKLRLLKEKDFSPMFTVTQMAKDFDLALDTGKSLDIPMPITAVTRQLYGAMKATGRGDFDYFGVVALMEELAGLNR